MRATAAFFAVVTLALSATHAYGQAAPVSLPLRVVGKQDFCTRLKATFASYGARSGYTPVQSTLMASQASAMMIAEFRAGHISDFVNAQALATLGRRQAIPQGDVYLPVAAFMGPAMGLQGNLAVALSASELRYLPMAQKGLDMLVIAQNGAALTPERAAKTIEVAQGLGIHIHVAWVGQGDQDAVVEARLLAMVASRTGGIFANLAGDGDSCGGEAL